MKAADDAVLTSMGQVLEAVLLSMKAHHQQSEPDVSHEWRFETFAPLSNAYLEELTLTRYLLL